MKKKLLVFLLIGSMTLSLLPVSVFAEDASESQKYNIWINGIQITDDNASDVLGDLDEGQTVVYDPFMETLILKGAQINTGYEYSENRVAGIYADGDLNIRLEGGTDENMSSIISAPESLELSCGIRVTGHLTISGDGMLTAASGVVIAADTIAENDFVISAGIYASEGLEILGYIPEDDSEEREAPIVTALGGTVTGNQHCSAYSNGVYTTGSLSVSSDGVLIAASGPVEAQNAYSFGVEVHGKTQYENILVEEGSLKSTSGQTFGVENAQSSSIYAENCGLYVSGDSSRVNLYSNPATVSSDSQAFQMGVFAAGGEVRLQGGSVTIDCMKSDDASGSEIVFGIYTQMTEEGDGGDVTLTEGTMDYSDNPAILHPSLTITTEDGYSIYAESGIYLDDCISITTPEGGSIIPTDNDQLFIVVDAEENPAANFHAEVTAEHE